MGNSKIKNISWLIARILITLFLGYHAYMSLMDSIEGYREISGKYAAIPPSMVVVLLAGLLIYLFVLVNLWFPQWLKSLCKLRQKSGILRWVLAFGLAVVISWLFQYSIHSTFLVGVWVRTLLYGGGFFIIAWLLTLKDTNLSIDGLLRSGIVFGSTFTIMREFKNAVDYPFSLSWSEGNRLFDYSVLFGRRLFDYPLGERIRVSIDIGRQTLWGLPFLFFKQPSILLVRAWSAFLYTIPYAIFGWIVFFHKGQKKSTWFLLGLYVLLFLYQGPVITPLVLVAILVALISPMPLVAGMLTAVVAGYLAYLSRFTWMYSAGMWAALLAFIEVNPKRVKSVKQRWLRAVLLGAAGLFGGYIIPRIIVAMGLLRQSPLTTGQNVTMDSLSDFATRHALLWNRLWPNTTYNLGIVFGLLLAAGAFAILLIIMGVKKPHRYDLWQKLLIFGELAAFLVVGVIVSVKIGGGSNLHNFDMLLITLIFLAAAFWKSGGDVAIKSPGNKRSVWVSILLLIAVFYPATRGMLQATPLILPEKEEITEAVGVIQQAVKNHSDEEILFMDQRQLLTFGYVDKIPLIPDYEKKNMMNAAMAANERYFKVLYDDLRADRFGMIVSEPLRMDNFQQITYEGGFSEENNAWVEWVSIPVLCYYQPMYTDETFSFQLLVPREGGYPPEIRQFCENLP